MSPYALTNIVIPTRDVLSGAESAAGAMSPALSVLCVVFLSLGFYWPMWYWDAIACCWGSLQTLKSCPCLCRLQCACLLWICVLLTTTAPPIVLMMVVEQCSAIRSIRFSSYTCMYDCILLSSAIDKQPYTPALSLQQMLHHLVDDCAKERH